MKILVTGCSSYIAKDIIFEFLNKSNTVYGISRSNPKISHKKFKWFKHDLSKSPFTNIKKVDYVVHVAGAVFKKKRNKLTYYKSNIVASMNLVLMKDLLKPILVFYTSTRDVYIQKGQKVLNENGPTIKLNFDKMLNSVNYYAQTKYLSEIILKSAYSVICMRLNSVLGKKSQGWISDLFKKMKKNEKIIFENNKFNNFTYVSDVSLTIKSFIKKKIVKSTDINIACSDISSSGQVINFLKKKMNSKSKVVKIKKRNKSFTISTKKLSKYCHTMNVEKALTKFLESRGYQ